MSAIFISHSSRDAAVAAEVRERLAEQGHRSVFLDFDPAVGIPAGRDWERELYRRLRACQAVIVLCSEHSMASRWCFVEITHAKAFGKHIFPVKVGECTIDGTLTSRQVLDLTADREDAYARLWRGLEVAGLDPKDAFDWDGSRPPYPGLLAFQEADAAIFFGRDGEIQRGLEVLNRLLRFGGARAVLVLGASGSGKSSLVRAGLLPRLARNPEEWLVVAPFRPLGRPLRELATAIAWTAGEHGQRLGWRAVDDRLRAGAAAGDALGDDAEADPEADREADPEADGDPLGDVARDLRLAAGRPRATVLLVIDQAEELLGAGEETARFLGVLRAALDARDRAVMAVLTLRSDLLGSFQKAPALRGFEAEDLRVGPIPASGVAQVIEGPARLAALELEPGLAQRMVADAETDDALPLLAFTLRELYELDQRRGRGDGLTVADYRDTLGGLAGSVARAADAVYAARALTGDEREDLRRAFLALATVDREGRYVRQPAPWATLPESVHGVLESFVAARLLTSRDEGGERVLEVAHEAIFRSWARLKDWLEQDRELFLWRRRLGDACREWQRTGRDPASLLRGPALSEARGWLGREGGRLRDDERELILTSVAAERARKRRRLTVLAATVLFLVAVAAGGITLWRKAERQRAKAVDLGRVALAGDWLDDDPTLAALALLDLRNPDAVGATALMSEALQRTLAYVELAGHQGGLTDVSFDLTGERLVVASADGTASIWSADGQPLATLTGHGDRVTAASFSPDGGRVVTASCDGTARVWSARGALVAVLEGHGDRVVAASFSPDGEWVLTASYDATARLWRSDGEGEPSVLAGHQGALTAAVFSPEGSRVLTASKDGTARLWRADGEGEPRVLSGHDGALTSASFSADGGLLVTASVDGTARVWRTDGEARPVVLRGHGDAVTWAELDRQGTRVVSASEDGTARVWRADGEGQPLILAGHGDAVTRASFNRKGDRVITASLDETAREWTAGREGELMVLRGHRGPVARAAFSVDGLRLVTASEDGTARVWTATGAGVAAVVLDDQQNRITVAAFSPDGDRVATGLQDHSLWVWEADGSCPVRLGAHGDAIRSISWNASSERLVSVSEDGAVWVWHADGAGEAVALPGTDYRVSAAALSPLGNRVATASEDGRVRVGFAGGVGEPVVFTAHDDVVEAVAFSPDGERLVTASQDLTARVWRADGGGSPVVLGPHRGWVTAAAFDPSGERVVTLSTDRRARIWRADGSGAPLVLHEHSVATGSAVFSLDGTRLATLRHEDAVRIWNADGSGRPLVLEAGERHVLGLAFGESGESLLTVSSDGRVEKSLLTAERLLRAIETATRVCLEPDKRERFLRETAAEALEGYQACESAAGRAPRQ